jgi:hypothetical protein
MKPTKKAEDMFSRNLYQAVVIQGLLRTLGTVHRSGPISISLIDATRTLSLDLLSHRKVGMLEREWLVGNICFGPLHLEFRSMKCFKLSCKLVLSRRFAIII